MTHVNDKCQVENINVLKLVKFFVDGKEFYLPAGFYSVEDIKLVSGIKSIRRLLRLVGNSTDHLDDTEAVAIDGNESFQSCGPHGQAS